MKGFLFDENIPSRLIFTPSLPVFDTNILGQSPSDTMLWAHARANSYVIVTKDTDFSNRIMLSVPPPWVVHLRSGNMRKWEFHRLLASVWLQVEALLPAHKLINVYVDRIEAIR